MCSLQPSPELTQHDIDCQMVRMRVFQQAVKSLFRGLYLHKRTETEEDKHVCKILLQWACTQEDLVASNALPDAYQRAPNNAIPIVCVPFLLPAVLPSQAEHPLLYEVYVKGSWFLEEFQSMVYILEEWSKMPG
jgi:hypothetical protein